MVQDISAAKARAASGMKPTGPQAGDSGILEQEAAALARQEQTARLREARLATEAKVRSASSAVKGIQITELNDRSQSPSVDVIPTEMMVYAVRNLTAAQVRLACDLLRWKSATLSRRAKVSFKTAWSARQDNMIRSISALELWTIQQTIEKVGVRFEVDAVGSPGAVLVKA